MLRSMANSLLGLVTMRGRGIVENSRALEPLTLSLDAVQTSNWISCNVLFLRLKYTYRFKQSKDVPGLVYWKPLTPGQRHKISIDFDALGVYTGPPVPSLSLKVPKTGGRDHTGRLRVRGRGGGEDKVLRTVDYRRVDLDNVKGVIQRIEHDPNRTGFLALTRYDPEGSLPIYRYHVAPHGLKPGSVIMAGPAAPMAPGCVLPLRDIPIGQPVYNLELSPGSGGKLVRAAHTFAVIAVKQDNKAIVKLPSGEMRAFPEDCRATVGTVSNHLQRMINLGKAGANRARGRRPKVRGIAMNPVDHPHGGRTNGGRPSCTPWGVYTKGKRTRKRNNPTNQFILMRKGGQPISKFVNAKKKAVREAAMKRKNKQGSASSKS